MIAATALAASAREVVAVMMETTVEVGHSVAAAMAATSGSAGQERDWVAVVAAKAARVEAAVAREVAGGSRSCHR